MATWSPTSAAVERTVVVITGAAPLDRRGRRGAPRATPRSSPPTAASTTPSPPGWRRRSSSATSTRSRPIGLAWASEHTEVVRHPVDKAATDTELAVAHAATLAPQRTPARSPAQGDRLDHAVAALGALGAPELAGDRARSRRGGAATSLHVVHGPGTRRARPAGRHDRSRCSPCTGRAPGSPSAAPAGRCDDADLAPLVGLGVSNQVDGAAGRASASPTASSPSIVPGAAS